LFDDSTNVQCAPNTKDLGTQDGYHAGQKVKIRICAVSNLPSSSSESRGQFGVSGADGKAVVNSRASGAVYAMVEAAKKAGVNLEASSAFRTMAHQQALCPCDRVTVAIPGTSNHQMGLAIDFAGLPGSPGPIPSSPVWNWLSKNAGKYGYKNYPREAWHWSPTGS
jgi:LAS superfamily LD-carboxypeptidase LdcB